jgi:energy-coupling factor transport system ATP-binding protein
VYQDPDTQIIFSCVEDEMAFGPENLCISREDILKRIDHILELLDIQGLRYRNPNKLSGGEKQLVVLASILTLDVDIIILDEAMSQVDRQGKKRILKAIQRMKSAGKSIIMVEHTIENLSISDEILLLKEGKLQKFEGYL